MLLLHPSPFPRGKVYPSPYPCIGLFPPELRRKRKRERRKASVAKSSFLGPSWFRELVVFSHSLGNVCQNLSAVPTIAGFLFAKALTYRKDGKLIINNLLLNKKALAIRVNFADAALLAAGNVLIRYLQCRFIRDPECYSVQTTSQR